MRFEEISLDDIGELSKMYVETFNAPPWNDEWTIEAAAKRLTQFVNCEDSYGLTAYEDNVLLGMILGSEEQFYTGNMFNIKEFCVKNDMRSKGIGTKILAEFENRLKSKGIVSIVLFTSRNDGTKGFYENRGYGEIKDMVMMAKGL